VADAARFRTGRAAQQFPWLAPGRPESQYGDSDPSAERICALFAALSNSSDDECGRRHLVALLGAELAPQSVGISGGERDAAALGGLGHPEGLAGRGLAVRA